MDFVGGSGAAWAVMVVRATKPASVVIVARISASVGTPADGARQWLIQPERANLFGASLFSIESYRGRWFAYSAASGSIKLGSLFLTLPTRWVTGQHVISAEG